MVSSTRVSYSRREKNTKIMVTSKSTIVCLKIILLSFFLFAGKTLAVPAAPIQHTLSQPDGVQFKARQWGDEWNHGWETLGGYSIARDASSKSWRFATIQAEGELIATDVLVGSNKQPPSNIPKHLRPTGLALNRIKQRKASSLSGKLTPGASGELNRVSPTGTANIPVILVNFSDRATTYTVGAFDTLLFGVGNRSMKAYYEEVSYGAFSVSPGPAGIQGWHTLSKGHDYYGSDDASGEDQWPGDLVYESVALTDGTVDFSVYDQDGDCYVDVVNIVHQGSDEASGGPSTDIWSHKWTISGAQYYGRSNYGAYTTNDACPAGGFIKIDKYVIQPETLYGQLHSVGVFVHEYGHALDLPDLYDIDSSSNGVARWGVMASGAWGSTDGLGGDTPVHFSAWSKYELGWVVPTLVTSTLVSEQIDQSATTSDVYKFLSGTEYFLVENRQQAGFDAGLIDSGLAIWHVDTAKSDNKDECYPPSNCSDSHYKVALVQADNLWELEKSLNKGDGGDLYPGSSANHEFSSTSSPNSNLYNGNVSSVHITNISASSATMSATLSAAAEAQGDQYEPDDASGQATTIYSGISQTHSIIPATDEDWVSFTLTGTSDLTIETSGTSGDTRMWLYDSNLTQIEYDDDNGAGSFSKITQAGLGAGTYYAKIDEYENNHEISSYTLTADFSSDSYTVTPSAGTNGTITPTDPQTVTEGATTQWTVTPDAGYAATIGGTCGGSLSGTTYTTNAITDNCTVAASFTAVAQGDQYEPDDASGQATTIQSGMAQTHSIIPATDEDWVSFTLTGTSDLTIETSGTSGDTRMWLYDSDLNEIAYNDDDGDVSLFSKITQTGLGAGTYYAKIDEYNNDAEISSYNVTAIFSSDSYTVTPSAGTNGTITPTDPQTVTEGATTQFTVTPDAGYVATIGGTCGGSLSGTYYTTNAITDNCTVAASFTAVTQGDQYEPDNNSGQATTIQSGIAQTHSIISATDEDWVSFTLTGTSDLTIETSGTSGDTRMWLYDSDLNEITYNDDGGVSLFSKITQTGLGAGTYYAKIDEYENNHEISSYTLTADFFEDQDDDGVIDLDDNCPLIDNPSQLDTDDDQVGDECDTDDDNDGVADSTDSWPYDSRYSSDSDNDGLPDAYESANGLSPTNAGDASADTDGDGLTVLEEFQHGTSDTNTDSDFDTLPDQWEVSNGRNGGTADYLISAGYSHSCALDDGGVRCWGYNNLGQNNVPVLENPAELVAGLYHTCAIDDTGIVCWGNNGSGQTNVPDLINPTQVSAGYWHTCAVDDNGVSCWGNNWYGQSTVPALSNPAQVSAGRHHSCAVDDSGVVCWGVIDPEEGEDSGESDPPALSNVKQVGVGYSHTCALHDSEVTCWGDNEVGQTDLPELSNPVQLATGRYHSCVVDDSGVVCWGNNYDGQIDFPRLRNPRQVSAGAYHTCALDDTGIVCMGYNDYGQTDVPLNNPILTSAGLYHSCAIDDSGVFCWGYNSLGQTSVPEELSQPVQVASAYSHTCAIDDSGVVCWGNNGNGQTDVPSLDAPRQVGAGQWHTCALDDSGVDCWGYNGDGQGDVPTLNNPTQLSVGYRHSCAVDDSGVQCWGYNEDGQIDVPTLTDATEVSAGSQHTCALDQSGVTCWGDNEVGQTDVPELSNPVQLATSRHHSCVVDDSGVVCWGNNYDGQTDVPDLINPTHVSVGAWHTCAIDDTGAVCWGYNGQGQADVPLMFDPDGDGVTNQDRKDALPLDATETQDTDDDGVGNNADTDDDGDGTEDAVDAFPLDSTEWIDTDGDGTGNNADADDDDDGLSDADEGFYGTDPLLADTDSDGVSDSLDDLPLDETETIDTDADGIGNNADEDDDGDDLSDSAEDGLGTDPLVADSDGDGTDDGSDAFPLNAAESADTDEDGVGDNTDVFPEDATETVDADSDGVGDNADLFDDDPLEAFDYDLDGMGDNTDLDDDNDGFSDLEEEEAGTDPLNASSCPGCFTWDIDADGEAKPLTDGLLVIRYLFDFSGDSLTAGAIGGTAQRTSAEDIMAYLSDAEFELDIDGDGEATPLTDGLVLIRSLFDFSGDSLIEGAIGDNAQRTTAEDVSAYIEQRMP